MKYPFTWRVGLRVSEALSPEARDLSPDSDLPAIHMRRGKRTKLRVVTVHPELHGALASSLNHTKRDILTPSAIKTQGNHILTVPCSQTVNLRCRSRTAPETSRESVSETECDCPA